MKALLLRTITAQRRAGPFEFVDLGAQTCRRRAAISLDPDQMMHIQPMSSHGLEPIMSSLSSTLKTDLLSSVIAH
jgi:hypothetical protein